MSVYNVVITSIIVILAANIIGERTTLAYVIITTLIFTSTTTTLCLLFIPKILVIWRRTEGDPIVESMGLKIQYNTRRLLTEDKREKYYRAEVQNKVYRREMLKLDQDLHKLHRRVESPASPTSSTGSIVKQESISSGASNNCRRGRGAAEGTGDCGSGDGAAGWGAGGSEDGEARVLMLGTPHTQYLRSDDATVRRVKRERMNRSLHRSLPSLPLGFSPEKVPDTRLPADGAEDDSESASCGRSQVFFDAFRFHEDQEEARRQAEEEDCDDDENSPKLGAFPSSPHPLQRSRLVKRSPIKPRPEPEDEGIVDLRYTLNFSTPLLHGVTEADLPFSISTHVHHGPRVSFRDQDAHHYYDAGRERRKSSLSSYSSPEVRRPRNTCSSTDIRLQIECSNVLQDEKLSPVVEYRVNDLDVLCPRSQKKVRTQDTEESVSPSEKGDDPGGGAADSCRPASNGALNRTPATGNNCLELRHGRSPKNNSRKTTAENSAMSSTTRPAGHIFSTVIVHHVANVHI